MGELKKPLKIAFFAICWIVWALVAFVTVYLAVYGVKNVLAHSSAGTAYWGGMVIGYYGVVALVAYVLWRTLRLLMDG